MRTLNVSIGLLLATGTVPVFAQQRAAKSLEAAEELSRATGRPILAVAGAET